MVACSFYECCRGRQTLSQASQEPRSQRGTQSFGWVFFCFSFLLGFIYMLDHKGELSFSVENHIRFFLRFGFIYMFDHKEELSLLVENNIRFFLSFRIYIHVRSQRRTQSLGWKLYPFFLTFRIYIHVRSQIISTSFYGHDIYMFNHRGESNISLEMLLAIAISNACI